MTIWVRIHLGPVNFCYVNCNHSLHFISYVIVNHPYVATWVIAFILRSILSTTKVVVFCFVMLCTSVAGYQGVVATNISEGSSASAFRAAVSYKTTWCHDTEQLNCNFHCLENLESQPFLYKYSALCSLFICISLFLY